MPSTAKPLLRHWAWGAWIVLAIPGLIVYFLLPGFGRDISYELFGLASVLAIGIATLLHEAPETKAWWRRLALAIALLVIGDALATLLPLLGDDAFPSYSDAAYLVGYGVLIWAVARLVGPGDRGLHRPNLLDASLVASATAIVVWIWIIGPLSSGSEDLLATGVAISYPIMDVVLLFVLLRHLLASGTKSRATWLLAAGVAAFLGADLVYAGLSLDGGYQSGTILDLGWLGGYVLFGAAALHPSMARMVGPAEGTDPISRSRIALIVGALAVGAGALVFGPPAPPGTEWVALVLAGLLGALFLTRLVGSLLQSAALLAESRTLRGELERQARTDSLTGLPNRAAMIDGMRAALAPTGPGAALLFLDLDKFKIVNDTWGHGTGDELLLGAAARIRAGVRAGDLVARLGGDEFAVLAVGVSVDAEAETIAARILAEFSAPFILGDTAHTVRPSIGISIGDPGAESARLLREADVAMYDAKHRGGNRWQVFRKAHEAVVERYRLASELEAAIDAGELVVHYQPLVRLEDGAIAGLEALVRWNHPEKGLLLPAAFIPVAEAGGLIGRLDRWVLLAALHQVRAWTDQGIWLDDQRMHVNFAPSDVEDPSVVDLVATALGEAGCPPGVLAIEVTESALLEVGAARRYLQEIAGMGVTLGLDDFGTRYAVLATLADLPFTILKIDRSFLLTLDNPAWARLFEGIVRLAERMGLQALAEGIETQEQHDAVVRLGCVLGQGFLMGRPAPALDVGLVLARHAAAWRRDEGSRLRIVS